MLPLENFVNKLMRYSGNIDVYVLGSDRQARDRFQKQGFYSSLYFKYKSVPDNVYPCYYLDHYLLPGDGLYRRIPGSFFCSAVYNLNTCTLLWNRPYFAGSRIMCPVLGLFFHTSAIYPAYRETRRYADADDVFYHCIT